MRALQGPVQREPAPVLRKEAGSSRLLPETARSGSRFRIPIRPWLHFNTLPDLYLIFVIVCNRIDTIRNFRFLQFISEIWKYGSIIPQRSSAP